MVPDTKSSQNINFRINVGSSLEATMILKLEDSCKMERNSITHGLIPMVRSRPNETYSWPLIIVIVIVVYVESP